MSEKTAKTSVTMSLIGAGIATVIAYVLIWSALRPFGSSTPLSDDERYVDLGASLLVFVLVFYRIRQGTWGREQVDKLLDIDDRGP
jgi:hypothetical protein